VIILFVDIGEIESHHGISFLLPRNICHIPVIVLIFL